MGPFGTTHDVADHQPAPGRDPRHRRHPQGARRHRRPRRRGRDRGAPRRLPRRSRGTTVRSTAPTRRRSSTRCAPCSRRATGRPSSRERPCITRCRCAGSGSFRTARRKRSSAPCTSTPTTSTCCCRSTRTSTRSGRARSREHILRDPASVGAELVVADRGGDVTYHGPGQLVGYPIVSLAEWRAGQRDVVAYVRRLEDVLDRGARRLRHRGRRGPRATRASGSATRRSRRSACGSRAGARGTASRSTSIPTSRCSSHIVPCGIRDRGVTSMARLLGRPVLDALRSPIVWSRGSPKRSASRPSTVRTSPGRPRRSPWRPAAARPSCHRCG